jgi:UDP-N-acetylglucosamine acyltransferase
MKADATHPPIAFGNVDRGKFIHPTAVIGENVTIGNNAYIGPLCVIGYPAEWKGKEHNDMGVIIEDGARLTGLVTVDSGANRPTIIGKDCYLMKHSHVGHDAILEDGVILSPGAKIGGHTIIGVNTNVGLNACVHQRLHIPYGCMIGMGAVVTKKTELVPKTKLAGVPAKIIGGNEV